MARDVVVVIIDSRLPVSNRVKTTVELFRAGQFPFTENRPNYEDTPNRRCNSDDDS
jgi:hypothetical protein